jgi:hypothetical protein
VGNCCVPQESTSAADSVEQQVHPQSHVR